MNSEPCRAVGNASAYTAFTTAPLGSEVITTSASSTAWAALSKIWAPLLAATSFAAGTGSKPRTVCPAATRFAAIGPPMWPRPKNAIVVI